MEFVSKDTIKRLLKDVKCIMQNPLTDNGIYYCHDDKDMLKGYALIIGPEDTPYFGGNYFFELKYPSDYPHRPPSVTYCTNGEDVRFNPNLYKCGKVCVSILNTWSGDQWTSCQSISTVLLTLCSLLCNNPLLNEPGVSKTHPEIKSYNHIIEYANMNVAICDIVMKKNGIYKAFFNLFYSYVKEHFLKNYDKILCIAEKNNEIWLKEKNKSVTITCYSMNVKINYPTILQKLKECKELFEKKDDSDAFECVL